MNTKKYKLIFYVITFTIVATITVQFFWNYKNYQSNKQRIANEIQLSFDNAIEEYYSSIAKSDFLTIVKNNSKKLKNKKGIASWLDTVVTKDSLQKPNVRVTNLKIISDTSTPFKLRDSVSNSIKKRAKLTNKKNSLLKKQNPFDSFKKKLFTQFIDSTNAVTLNTDGSVTNVKYFKGKKAADSLKLVADLKPIFISFLDKSVDYIKLDSLIQKQLIQKGINIENAFQHIKSDTIFKKTKDSLLVEKLFTAISKSTYIKKDEQFQLLYASPNIAALKRSYFGIFLSFLLALAVIFSLFYLLKIIKDQKELALIKNDLISNITHEFKTPIATVTSAIEAIENFNAINDKEKTEKYLNVSSFQLKKLHQMVEKLLETATLDSEQLLLKKENVDIVEITERTVNKFKLLTTDKQIVFTTNLKPIYSSVDVFHFENVLSNLIDNAIKYGGNTIEVNINSVLNATQILIADNGGGIDKNQQELLFDKFYRVPKGNTHNVKGFGIGLYYCKQIIEKHQGVITLLANKNETIFKIDLPNE
jgi:two-component system phosphate regulon sensor histidine kinase PhoR